MAPVGELEAAALIDMHNSAGKQLHLSEVDSLGPVHSRLTRLQVVQVVLAKSDVRVAGHALRQKQ